MELCFKPSNIESADGCFNHLIYLFGKKFTFSGINETNLDSKFYDVVNSSLLIGEVNKFWIYTDSTTCPSDAQLFSDCTHSGILEYMDGCGDSGLIYRGPVAIDCMSRYTVTIKTEATLPISCEQF